MAVVTGNDYDHIDIVNGNTQTRHMIKDASARADISDLKSALNGLEDYLPLYKSTLTLITGYYNATTGVLVEEESGWKCTSKITTNKLPNLSTNPTHCNIWLNGSYIGKYAYSDFGNLPTFDVIAFTWRKTDVPTVGIIITPDGDLYNMVDDIETDVDRILTNGKISLSWEQGGYNVAYGTTLSSDTRIRITDKLTAFSNITSKIGYEFILYVWDGSTYKGCFSGNGFDKSAIHAFTKLMYSDISSYVSGFTSPKYAIVGKNASNTDITTSASGNFSAYDGDYNYDYEELQKTVYEMKSNGTNPFFGKSLAVDGSSIMAGAGYSGGWAKIIGDTYGMSVTNRAVNGATIANTNRHSLATSIDTTPVSDYFIFDTMRNDYVLDVPFGTPSADDDYSPTLDKTTFCGAFEYVCMKLATTYGTEKIGYVFPHRRPPIEDDLVNTWKPFAIRTLKKWGIPYIDLEELDPPIGFIPALYQAYTDSQDKVHPNQQGYEIFYVPKIVAWMKTL